MIFLAFLCGIANIVFMRRVTSKQKRVKETVNSSTHLVFSSTRHEEDKKVADRLREMPLVPRVKRGPFPGGKELSFQGHFKGDYFHIQGEEEFVEENVLAKKENSWYLREDKRRPNSLGRKSKTGIMELNVSLPVGVSLCFARACKKNPDNIKVVRKMLLEVGFAGIEKARRLTGYKPIYVALHPDSEGVLSFHFGLSPVDTKSRKLLGISATGKRGRKGLRLLGDAFMSILRHARYVPIPERLMLLPKRALKEEGRRGDWEIGLVMEKKALALGKGKWGNFEQLAHSFGKEEAENWLKRIDLFELLERENLELKKENAELKKRVKKLDKKRVELGPEML